VSRGTHPSGFLLIAVGLIAALLIASAPAPAASGGATAVAAKKCKKKHHKKRKCKKHHAAAEPALPAVYVAISPSSHDFGSVTHSTSSSSFTFTVINNSWAQSRFSINLGPGPSGVFAFGPGGTCGSTAIPLGGSCTFSMRFVAPAAPGSYTQTVTATATDAYDASATATMTGKSV
jgi:hypothetical protein